MPRRNQTEAEQKAQREELIRTRKENKRPLIQRWIEEQKQKIARDTDPAQKIAAESEKIDKQAGQDKIRLEMEMKDAWAAHIKELEKELAELDSNESGKYEEEAAVINRDYHEKTTQEKQRCQEAVTEIETQYHANLQKLHDERARVEKEFQNKKKELQERKEENEKKLADIDNSLNLTMEAVNMLSANMNGRNKNEAAPSEQLEQMRASMVNLSSAKSKILDAEAQMSISVDKLAEVLSQLQKPERLTELEDQMKKGKDAAWKNYSAKEAGIEQERQKALSAKKNELKKIRAAKADELEKTKKVTMDEVIFSRRYDNITERANIEKYHIKQKLEQEAETDKNMKTRELNGNVQCLQNRLFAGVEFDLEVEDLEHSYKKEANTEEFNRMVSTLKESVTAVETCDLTEETQAEIRRSCLEAYRACENYIQAKNRQNIFVKIFRSGSGTKRLEMAAAMKARLLEFCPGLEQALSQEENAAAPQKEEQKERPSAGGKENHTDVRKELDDAKKKVKDKRKKENHEEKKVESKDKKTKTKVNVK